MSTSYISTFNSGELSSKMDARTDLKIYDAGCKKLQNFQVLSQGGVERRTGTKFVAETNTGDVNAGDNPVQLIPFDFSIDSSYVIEIGVGYINVISKDYTNVTVSAKAGHTIPSYTASDLGDIQFVRRFDTVILTHPNHAPQLLQRTVIEPSLAFEISEIEYEYPPLLEENTSNITLTASATTGTSVTLQASDAVFNDGHVGSVWAINEIRSASQVSIDLDDSNNWTLETSNNYVSTALDLSFVNFHIQTDNQSNAAGTATIQRSINGGAFEDYAILGTATNGQNFGFASTAPQGKSVRIRLHINTADITKWGGEFATDNIYIKGLIEITSVTDADTATVSIISPLANTDATVHWNEAGFSTFRGFPRSAQFYEDRLWFTGSEVEPSTIFASATSDYYNFLLDPILDSGIKRIVDSSENARWLQGKRYLFMGTTGTTVSIRSADRDALINLNNISTQNENTYGSADIQAELSNDVVVYAQADKRKLRALYYNREEDIYKSSNLNFANDEILDSGIKEMFIQKQPYQIIWCILNNGDMASLTYERDEEVTGWSLFKTDGEFISGCSVPGNSEDFVWVCVKRSGKYLIEQFQPKRNLDWYVDSGKRLDGGAAVSAPLDVEDSKVKITKTNHNLNGKYIKINSLINQFDKQVYFVDQIDANNFYLKNITDTNQFIEYLPTGNEVESNLPPTVTFSPSNEIYYQSVTTRTDGATIPSSVYLNYPIEPIASNVWAAGVSYSVGDKIFPDTNYNQVWQCSVAHTSSGTFPNYSNFGGSPIWSYSDLNDITLEWNTGGSLHRNQWILYDTYDGAYEGFIATSTSSSQNRYFVPKDGWTLLNTTTIRDPNITDNITYNEVFNTITALNHIEGKTVQVVVDESFIGEATVTNNSITTDQYYNKLLVGLKFESILQPLPIQPKIRFSSAQGSIKAVTKSIARFYKSLGGKMGESGKQLTPIPTLDTFDPSGKVVEVKTGEQRVFHSSDWNREKILEIKQDLPNPMTVLSISTDVMTEGM